MSCQNLGTFKEYTDIGLTSYRNLRFSTCQNLGVFHIIRTMFLTPKTHGLLLLVKILGLLKSAKILGLQCIKIPGLTPVEILGCFLRTRFRHQKHIACAVCQNLGIFKECKDIGATLYPNPSFNTSQNLGLFHKNHVS